MIEDALEKLGPCLSTELTEYLVNNFHLTNAAARQRVSRAPATVKRLAHLPFQRKSRFLYLQRHYASPWYWESLYRAIYSTNGAYARALGAVDARRILPLEHFKIACGAPIAQKKHISADTVLERLVRADVLVKEQIPGLGDCVMSKKTYDEIGLNGEIIIAETKSRIKVENILLENISEWLRRLSFASYNSIKTRIDSEATAPKAGTFTWDLTAPSYIAGLTDRKSNKVKPGLILCDVLLNKKALIHHVKPFIYKVSSTQSMKRIGRSIFIFVAQKYDSEAFNALRTAGVIPATPYSLFGKDFAAVLHDLIKTLNKANIGELNLNQFNDLLNKSNKLEGALGNMRGTLFEFLVAEVVRKRSPAQVQLNKICTTKSGEVAEVDVWELKEGIVARMIECKGMAPDKQVSDEEIDSWLTKRIPRVRECLSNKDTGPINPTFELWTSGIISDKSLERIYKTKEANAAKFELGIVNQQKLKEIVESVNDKPLKNIFKQHYLPKNKK